MAGSHGFAVLRDRILDLAQPSGGDRALDVGAGTGLLTLALAASVNHVVALDISPAMCRHLEGKLARSGIGNVDVRTGSATRMPLDDASVDLVVSNYCYHHLNDRDKQRALADARRVLRPGGRLVVGDMMFRLSLRASRDRAVIAAVLVRLMRRGPAGLVRVAKNAVRYLAGRWEHPADIDWWREALSRAGFVAVDVQALDHEGGIAVARHAALTVPAPSRPATEPRAQSR
jgi:ubiquinone/menaquinone biosynthesis C-methylase UbiE